MNRFVEAKLMDYKTINVCITHPNKNLDYIFTLVVRPDYRFRINGKIKEKTPNLVIYEFKLDKELELGVDYHVAITNIGIYPLNVSPIASLQDFDNRYAYDGDDLGNIYKRNETKFAVWAPLASSVILLLDNKKAFKMNRTDRGVYRLTIPKNLKGHFYNYLVTNSGVTTKTIDPYAKASLPNAEGTVILDMNSFKMNMHDKHPKKMHSYLDAIIYEGHVRDLTIDKNTNIVHKGKFLGLIEEGRTSIDGEPAGFDYISNLGITHLQLLPIYDYATVDELNPDKTYNWGYDPQQYFVPEGSYASNVKDPRSRIEDLLKLVSKYHEKGIRIVMDVVFNHVYEHQHSSLEAIVPNYYFRRTNEGVYFNSSGCGNDLASERKMVRKLIIDACVYWVKFYHIDGFRFDLMGIIDADTINELKLKIFEMKDSFMFYGEGWNMSSGYNLTLANESNAHVINLVSFFNDQFRDVVAGNVGGNTQGYALNNGYVHQQIKENMIGSSFRLLGDSKFFHIACSLNFVECHDNHTLFDKFTLLRPDMSLDEKLERVIFANALVMFAYGIPFFHAGQEIGLSKKNNGNTYNMGDSYNKFDYSLLKKRKHMVTDFKKMTMLRKQTKIFHEYRMDVLDRNTQIDDIDNNGIKISYNTRFENSRSYCKINMYINPSNEEVKCYENDKEINIPPMSIRFRKVN